MKLGKHALLILASALLFAGSLAYTATRLLDASLFSKSLSRKIDSSISKLPIRKTEPATHPIPIESLTNIFSPGSGMSLKSKLEGTIVSGEGPISSPSDFKLTGTIYSDDPKLRRAIIFIKNQRVEKYLREGDSFLDGYKIIKIEREKILVERGGTIAQIAISPPERKNRPARARYTRRRTIPSTTSKSAKNIKVTRLSDTSFAVDERTVDYLTENINKLISHVRIIPYFESGKPAGFRLAAIRPGSEFSLLGFSPGDIIKKVNGIPLTSPEKIYTIFQNLKDERKIEVDILRRGKKLTIEYEIR